MTGSVETFQISLDAAEIYEKKFVPALFGEWAPHLIDFADVAPGHSVLDVACGTGVVTRAAADRTGWTRQRRGAGHQRRHARSRPAAAAGRRVAEGGRSGPSFSRRLI